VDDLYGLLFHNVERVSFVLVVKLTYGLQEGWLQHATLQLHLVSLLHLRRNCVVAPGVDVIEPL
jgi:hypothetical protein